jgi:hypothetical protein
LARVFSVIVARRSCSAAVSFETPAELLDRGGRVVRGPDQTFPAQRPHSLVDGALHHDQLVDALLLLGAELLHVGDPLDDVRDRRHQSASPSTFAQAASPSAR